MKKPVSPLDRHLGFWLRKLSNAVSHAFADRLARHEVSVAQWVVLRVLYDHEALALKDVVRQVGGDQGALSRMVDRLLVRGLVERVGDPDDRRAVCISLTREGRLLVPVLAREADDNDQAFFAAMPSREREQLLHTIQTLLRANGVSATDQPLD